MRSSVIHINVILDFGSVRDVMQMWRQEMGEKYLCFLFNAVNLKPFENIKSLSQKRNFDQYIILGQDKIQPFKTCLLLDETSVTRYHMSFSYSLS